jgi:hypothetical protein
MISVVVFFFVLPSFALIILLIFQIANIIYKDTNLATAAKYFSYVVSRNPQNPRALWGLYRSLLAQKDAISEQDR